MNRVSFLFVVILAHLVGLRLGGPVLHDIFWVFATDVVWLLPVQVFVRLSIHNCIDGHCCESFDAPIKLLPRAWSRLVEVRAPLCTIRFPYICNCFVPVSMMLLMPLWLYSTARRALQCSGWVTLSSRAS